MKKTGPKTWTEGAGRKPGPRKKVEEPGNPTRKVDTMRSERLMPIVRRANELRSEGLYLREIATILGDEFKISIPSDASVSRWCADATRAYLADIKGFRANRTFELLQQNEALRRKFLPIALADELAITRYRKEKGEMVAFTDENAFVEQAKAAEVVIKCQKVEMELLGLKGGAGIIEQAGGEQSISDLFAYMGKLAARAVTSPDGAHDGSPVLEMRSGLEATWGSESP